MQLHWNGCIRMNASALFQRFWSKRLAKQAQPNPMLKVKLNMQPYVEVTRGRRRRAVCGPRGLLVRCVAGLDYRKNTPENF